MGQNLRKDFWTLPNVISLFRLLFGAPITIWFFMSDYYELAWLVFLFFIATDFLDGQISRWQKSGSSWGMILDPLADQFLVLPVIWMFYLAGIINSFLPTFLVVRETLMVLVRVFAKRDMPANFLGKAKVVAEYVGITFLLMGGEWYLFGLLMFFPVMILAAVSLIKYAYDVFLRREKEAVQC